MNESEASNSEKTIENESENCASQCNINGCLLPKLSTNLVRIEYPGLVKDVAKALETLGGLNNVEKVISENKSTLELKFHPENLFSKPTLGELDTNPGILLQVNPSNTQDYEILGATSFNYKFNRLCDFQYLPIVENEDGTDQFVYENIFPKKVPNMEWFLSSNIINQSKFFCPTTFSKFDAPHNKLYLNAYERFNSPTKPPTAKLSKNVSEKRQKKKKFVKNITIFVNMIDPNAEIPKEPLSITLQIMKERKLMANYMKVKALFEERPIWVKAAVQYKLKLNSDQIKIILPSVGYFCNIGPWRTCWIKFGYNPLKDYNSRMYQTLDYRIRTKEGIQLKIKAKRSSKNAYNPGQVQSTSKSDKLNAFDESTFVLKPGLVPPARQMFYQYCDIQLPQIQEMIQRLPKYPTNIRFDPKSGWLPSNFTEQCREIVTKYLNEEIHKEFLEETKKVKAETADSDKSWQSSSRILSNIQCGAYKREMVPRLRSESEEIVDIVDLNEDSDENDALNMSELVDSLSETVEDNSDEEDTFSVTSELDIDMELVEEINQLVASREQSKNAQN